MTIGLFGGSFNPIHNGHIELAKHMLEAASLDEIWFVVSPQNPFKKSIDLLPEKIRFEMTSVALNNEEHLVASDYEFGLPRPSYTWNLLQHLKQDYHEHEFVLIMGADNWMVFDKWSHSSEILQNYRILVHSRDDIRIGSVPNNVQVINAQQCDISSTMIRQRVREHLSITGLVPESIEEMIIQHYKY